MRMKPNNPFLIAGYYSPEYFCDSENSTATIIGALKNGRNITLISPRRMGKTGLIQHTFHRLKEIEPDAVTLYMDIYSTQSLGDFVRLFASTVLGTLDTLPQKAISRVGEFIRSCRPAITFDEYTGIPKVTIDISPADEEHTLKEIFAYLGSSERRCYIAIDEFQQITEYPEKGIEALLRSYIHFLPGVNFIFAGSKQHVMREMFLSAKKPFYQSTQLHTIDVINREAYAEFAVAHFDRQGTQLPKEVFYAIYEKFDGHTWYVQSILNRLFSYHRNIDVTLVETAIQEILNEQCYSYAELMNAYSDGCVRLLKAIAREGCVKEVMAGDFIAKHRLRAASSVKSVLNKLLGNELIYHSAKGYMVYDRFMSLWLRRLPF